MGELRRINLLVPAAPSADTLLPYLRALDQAKWYSNFGQMVRTLETKLGQFASCVTVSSGTTAIELSLRAVADGRKHLNVYVPSFTYPATICAIINAGHAPVFGDVSPSDWSLVGDAPINCDLILPVCPLGHRVDWIHKLGNENIVVDAAAGCLNQRNSEKFLTCYSLHATKYPGAGEGGYVIGPQKLVSKIRKLSFFGMNAERACEIPGGTNAKLSEYHAAVALAALKELPKSIFILGKLETLYRKLIVELAAYKGLDIQFQGGRKSEDAAVFCILLPDDMDISEIMAFMGIRGIETRRWYYPLCHTMPAFRHFQRSHLPVSENISKRLLGLPFHTHLSTDDVSHVVTVLSEAISYQKGKTSIFIGAKHV